MNNALTTIKRNKVTIKICEDNISRLIKKIELKNNSLFSEIYDLIQVFKFKNKSTVIGKGVSKCSDEDVYDEKIGDEIAFVKAKINANIKKRNFLKKIYTKSFEFVALLNEEIVKLDEYINKDIDKIRKHNPKYEIH